MRLVKGAREAYKWFSVQSMAAAIAIQTTWMQLPAELKATIPEWFVSYGTAGILFLGIIGRLAPQGDDDA